MPYITNKAPCVNADKSAIVDCEGPDAAYVLAGPGAALTDAQVAKYGLGKPEKASAAVEASPEPEQKAVEAAPENKAVAMSPQRKSAVKK